MDLKKNYEEIKQKAKEALKETGRSLDDILILGVSKTVDTDTLNEAVKLGITTLGENRVQELLEKYDKVEGTSWHLIGHLQTNKVKYIIDKVELIHSVDSIKLLNEISRCAKKIGKVQRVLIEINVSGEESKFGVPIDDAYEFLEEAKTIENVKIEGFMTMAPLLETEENVHAIFKKLYNLYIDIKDKKYDNISMKYLSMGMSQDYHIALLEGANIIRVGRNLFKR
ncbi:MAG: YggS family pyridoxal phosphate-dependent enzyme [Ruminococcaceae bacterium]|nr:YggS family pyridoxal phosphate-dependent enzyme [Oscillospiraceae bacterium]